MKPQATASLHAAHVNGGNPLLRRAGVYFDTPDDEIPGVTLPGERRSAPAQTTRTAPAPQEPQRAQRTAEAQPTYHAPSVATPAPREPEEPQTRTGERAEQTAEEHVTLSRSLEQIGAVLQRLDENQTRIVAALSGEESMPGPVVERDGTRHEAPTREDLQRRAEQIDRERAELQRAQEIHQRDMQRSVGLRGLDEEQAAEFNLARAAVIARFGIDDARIRAQRWVETDIIAAYMQRDSAGIGSPSLGGVLLPTEVSQGIADRLAPRNIAIRLGAQVIPMGRTFDMIFPQQETGGTAYWTGSEKQVTESDISFGYYRLTAKPLASMAAFTDDGEYFTNMALSRQLESELLRDHSEALDEAIFVGEGASGEPTGIANTSQIQSIDWGALSGGTATEVSVAALSGATQKVTDILDDHQFALMEADALDADAQTAFAAHPSLYKILKRSKDADGNPLLFSPAQRGQTAGTVRTLTSTGIGEMYDTAAGATTKLPFGGIGSGTLSDLFYGDFNKIVIGQFGPVEMRVTDSHASDFAFGRMRILMKQRLDAVLRRGQHFTVASNLKLVA